MADPVRPHLVVLGIKLADEPGLTSYESGTLDSDTVSHLYGAAQVVLYPTHYEGFGFPIMSALGYRKPVIARRLPVFEEIKLVVPGRANIHLFDTTMEMVRFALRMPAWIDSEEEADVTHGWDDTAHAINKALKEARDRFGFDALYEQQVAVSACQSLIERTAQQTSAALLEKRAKLAEASATLFEEQAKTAACQTAYLLESRSWKVTAPLRRMSKLGQATYSAGHRALRTFAKSIGAKR